MSLKEFSPDGSQSQGEQIKQLLRLLNYQREIICPAYLITGYHFSPKQLSEIHPTSGVLYYFPYMPNQQDQEAISYNVLNESGWAGRSSQSHIGSLLQGSFVGEGPFDESASRRSISYCHEIVPTFEISRNSFLLQLGPALIHGRNQSIKVLADDRHVWLARQCIPVQARPHR